MRTVWLNAFALGAIALATTLMVVKNNRAETVVPAKPASVGSQLSTPLPAAQSANPRKAASATEARTVASDERGSVTTEARNQDAAR